MSHVPTVLKSDRSVFDKMLPVDDNATLTTSTLFLLLVKFKHLFLTCFFQSFLKDVFPNSLLTLNAPITTKVVCFSRLLKWLRSLYGKQDIGAVCSGSTLFASMHNSSVMLGSYLQQMTSADVIFRCTFFLAL